MHDDGDVVALSSAGATNALMIRLAVKVHSVETWDAGIAKRLHSSEKFPYELMSGGFELLRRDH